jgi:hypothetical protein
MGAYTPPAVAGTSTQPTDSRPPTRRWAWPLGAAGLVVVLALVVLLRGRDRFDGYVAAAGGTQEHVIRTNQVVDLVFIDREHSNTPYEVTFTHVNDHRTRRFRARTRGAGQLSRVRVHRAGTPSRVDVRWYVGGRVRDRWVFLVRPAKKTR